MPSSCGSTLPGTPPPGLKSRQTTPVIAPSFGFGTTACLAADERSSGGIAVSPISAVPPAAIGFLSTEPRLGEPVSTPVEGAASESAPTGENQVLTAPIPAL